MQFIKLLAGALLLLFQFGLVLCIIAIYHALQANPEQTILGGVLIIMLSVVLLMSFKVYSLLN